MWADDEVFFHDDFLDLHNWEPLYLPHVKNHTIYEAVKENGRTFLKTQSQASASALVSTKMFNPYIYPHLRWRWKVDNIYQKWDSKKKSGDDYPIRIYVMFQYNPESASFSEKLLYKTLKILYGQYPPHSSLCYAWASALTEDEMITSPYTKRAKLIFQEQGSAKLGQWLDEQANILDDYKKAFGKDPLDKAAIAIMNDSDDTGEAAVSYVEYVEVSK
jgi:hypothetical protein